MRGGARWFDGQGARIAEVLNSREQRKAELAASIRWDTEECPIVPETRIIRARLNVGGVEFNNHHAVYLRDLEHHRDAESYVANLARMMQGRLIQTAMGERNADDY